MTLLHDFSPGFHLVLNITGPVLRPQLKVSTKLWIYAFFTSNCICPDPCLPLLYRQIIRLTN